MRARSTAHPPTRCTSPRQHGARAWTRGTSASASSSSRVSRARAPGGRTYRRLRDGLPGRLDDMLIVRGENVYPSAIEATLRATDGLGGEFEVIVSRRETMDELLVRAEAAAGLGDPALLDALRALMRERLRARLGVHPIVELVPHGTLPRTEFKARRVIDDRDLYRHAVRDGRP